MDPYRQFVRRMEETLAVPLPEPDIRDFPRPPPSAPAAPVALLISPHPDDEVITGALPVRLQREAGARVVNLAVTLGSNSARREPRRREVENACVLLGWELEVLGWAGVRPDAAKGDLETETRADALAEVIRRWQPRWIFYPHALDAHPTHRAVSQLARLALDKFSAVAPPWRIETEYWRPNSQPNLLVECPPESLALLVAALCCHQGEIARNPYHSTLPSWMADNVRRGAELVSGAGQAAPDFKFGTLYRVEPELPPGWGAVLPANGLRKP
jgi:LmbE family N-acetylglucosaminyl deacetylase